MDQPTPTPTAHICQSCGNHFVGMYCNLCGEKVLLPRDKSFRKFLSSVLVAITFADNKFVRMCWHILRRPGFLSAEMAAGRRVKYLSPLSVFFVLNLIYFLFPTIQLFNASLRTQLNSLHGQIAGHWVVETMHKLGVRDITSFALIYDQKTTSLAKLLVIAFAIIASLPMNLIYRSAGRFFTDHTTMAVELTCFNLLVNALFLTLITPLLGLGSFMTETVLTVLFVTTNLYFLIRAGSNFYGAGLFASIWKAILMILVLKLSLELYRMGLFYVTIWSM